ncbi:hypothetical protein SNEBB_008833 [Seison nebaliae]|nr:hypothetical protein SNEBB_008833 [Seison nebaliae]
MFRYSLGKLRPQILLMKKKLIDPISKEMLNANQKIIPTLYFSRKETSKIHQEKLKKSLKHLLDNNHLNEAIYLLVHVGGNYKNIIQPYHYRIVMSALGRYGRLDQVLTLFNDSKNRNYVLEKMTKLDQKKMFVTIANTIRVAAFNLTIERKDDRINGDEFKREFLTIFYGMRKLMNLVERHLDRNELNDNQILRFALADAMAKCGDYDNTLKYLSPLAEKNSERLRSFSILFHSLLNQIQLNRLDLYNGELTIEITINQFYQIFQEFQQFIKDAQIRIDGTSGKYERQIQLIQRQYQIFNSLKINPNIPFKQSISDGNIPVNLLE